MGWTSLHRAKGTTNEEFFLAMFKKGTRIHASGTVNGVFYAAMETPSSPGQVWAFVALTAWAPNSSHNFSYKDMDETVGPCEAKAPLAVMKALTPTDKEYAIEWRRRVHLHHEQRKAMRGLKDGDQVVLGRALTFTTGAELDTFTVRRQRTRGGKQTRVVLTALGGAYHVPNWQDLVIATVRGGERQEAPYGAAATANA